MFCPKCGAQVENNQPFCPNCGTPFQPAAAPGYPAAPAYAPRPPMDLSKILMWVSLGLMVLASVLTFFGYRGSNTLLHAPVITVLNLFGIALMVMPLLGIAKANGKTSYFILLFASFALLTLLLEWIMTGAELGACGIIALIVQLGAVACTAIMFYLGREHKPRAPRPPYTGYPQA